ncbi:MAG: creatininase family protein [Theionarchaea archaeon]|nr:creatininase family protein [Theionarchaea archaeon]
MILREMSWFDLKDVLTEDTIAVVPVGSTEQHGPHNPLGTDHMIADRIAHGVRDDALITPTVPVGYSEHHRQFPGTLWVSPRVLEDYVLDICRSLQYHGIKKIVICNGHGGNTFPLMIVAMKMREQGIFVGLFEWWKASKEEDAHAGSGETSLNLFLYDHLVHMDRAKDSATEWSPPLHGTKVLYDTIDFSDDGTVGTPSRATKVKGEILYKDAVTQLKETIAYLKETPLEKLLAKGRVE